MIRFWNFLTFLLRKKAPEFVKNDPPLFFIATPKTLVYLPPWNETGGSLNWNTDREWSCAIACEWGKELAWRESVWVYVRACVRVREREWERETLQIRNECKRKRVRVCVRTRERETVMRDHPPMGLRGCWLNKERSIIEKMKKWLFKIESNQRLPQTLTIAVQLFRFV